MLLMHLAPRAVVNIPILNTPFDVVNPTCLDARLEPIIKEQE
jgi:hypothetical protein